MTPPIRRLIPVLLLLLAGISPASAQSISLDLKEATPEAITNELEKQTGYGFELTLEPDRQKAKHTVHWDKAPLATVLNELSRLFNCEFFSIDSGRFFAVKAEPVEGKQTVVGPYQLRFNKPAGEEGSPNAIGLTLMFTAPDDQQMEAIAGLGPDLRVVDNFGRSMADPAPRGLQSTGAIRVRLAEYWQRLQLARRDERAVRIRSISGSLVLYRRVTPVRLEFALDGSKLPPEQEQGGVSVRIEKVAGTAKELEVTTRAGWPDATRVVARGIGRTPLPYLVDVNGRVYRDTNGAQPRREPGGTTWAQQLRFEDLEAKPARLVYDLLVKEAPDRTIPFSLASIPLPVLPPPSSYKPEQRAFFAATGASLALTVTDRGGKPVEGEVSLGLSRKTATGWSGIRWIDAVTEPDGSVRLEKIQPGIY
ncbi:MAG: hypothetical protein K0Q72_2407, partial [Armatimonadetes bacterium]|nr:hypothetical protein [Armatimonadota bacterium]